MATKVIAFSLSLLAFALFVASRITINDGTWQGLLTSVKLQKLGGWVTAAALLVLAIAMLGCGQPFAGSAEIKAGQQAAVDTIWSLYGRAEPPPLVLWMEGDNLNCVSPAGNPGFRGVTAKGEQCVAGLTWSVAHVQVAYAGQPLHETALAHELWHAAMMRDLALDPLHTTEGWRPIGNSACEASNPRYAIVAWANRMLETFGL